MHHKSIFVISILFFFFGLIVPSFSQPPGWLYDARAGQARAVSQNRPMVLYFFNMEVRACRDLEVETFADRDVAQRLSEFVTVAVNITNRPDLLREHRLIKVPTVIFFNRQGVEVDRAIGFKSPEEFMLYLDQAEAAAPRTGGATIDILRPTPGTRPVTLSVRPPRPMNLWLVGDFNDWRTDAHPLQPGPGGVLGITIHLRDGVYEYKFVDEQENYFADGRNPNRIVNPFGTFNSILVVGERTKRSPVITPGRVTFYLYRPEARSIAVAGNFNNWQPQQMFRHPEDPAMWGIGFDLPPGDYRYKYVIDGEWTLDPENYSPVQEPDGTFNNSFRMR